MSSAPERVRVRAGVPNRVYQARVAAARHSWIRRHSDVGADLPVWTSRGGWVESVRTWAMTSGFKQVCVQANISIAGATVVAIAAVWATFADHSTGRNVAVTRARIANVIGCNPKTITRAWKVLQAGGFAVEIYHGHGSANTPGYGKRPSIWHLVSGERTGTNDVDNVPLPPLGGCSWESPVGTDSPSVRKRTPNRICRNSSGRRIRATPRPLSLQRFAGQFVAQTHGLGRGHVGGICDALEASELDLATWSVKALRDALEADMRATGWHWPDHIRNPTGFLLSRLRRLPSRPPQVSGSSRHGVLVDPEPIHDFPEVADLYESAATPGLVVWKLAAAAEGCCHRCGAPDAHRRPFLPPSRAMLCRPCWAGE